MPSVRYALIAAAAAALLAADAAQGGPPKPKPQLMDVPYIQCQVCELLAKNAWRQAKQLMKDATPTKKVDEMKVIEHMEKITTAWRPEGDWIAKLDLVEQGDRLVVKEMDQVGRCGVECKTVEKAAERIMGEHDTDVAEVLYAGKKTQAQFSNWLCHELTSVCKHPPSPLPKNRPPGLPFEPMPAGEQNLERMMGQMEDQGMRGSLYSRDDLMAKYGLPEGHDEDVDELPDRTEEFDGEPIDWHHIEGSERYTTRTPMRRVLEQAAQAAQAARSGFKAAADMAQGAWSRLRSNQKGEPEL